MKFAGRHVLSQALGGFNAALMTRHQVLQIPIDDPLASDQPPGVLEFTQRVHKAVGPHHRSAPLSSKVFSPIRAGGLTLDRLCLIDTFGQQWNINSAGARLIKSDTLDDPNAGAFIYLPPRIAAPTRLNFRWLAAQSGHDGTDEVEMNSHPATTPVCGWLIPNNFDNSPMVHDAAGVALGAINQLAEWVPAPEPDRRIAAAEIENPHLARLIARLVVDVRTPEEESEIRQHFLRSFLSTVDSALEGIEPASFAQHEALALLMGRPMAVVRAQVELQLMGQPMTPGSIDDPTIAGGKALTLSKSRRWKAFADQDWDVFAYDWGAFYGCSYDDVMHGRCDFLEPVCHVDDYPRTTHGFENVTLPIRLGEHGVDLPPPSSDWQVRKAIQKVRTVVPGNPQWHITLTKTVVLGVQDPVLFTFSGIKTDLDPGYARMYVQYRNLPGHSDGILIAELEKTPLLYGTTRGQGAYLSAGIPAGSTPPPPPNYDSSGLLVEQFGANPAVTLRGGTGLLVQPTAEEHLILTHPDEDHYNQLKYLSNVQFNHAYYGGDLSLYQNKKDNNYTYSLLAHMTANNIAGWPPNSTSTKPDPALSRAGVNVTILAANATGRPEDKSGAGKNANSIVLLVEYGGSKIFLMGDAFMNIEIGILNAFLTANALGRLQKGAADQVVLKMGHHGSDTSTCPQWVTTISPSILTISSGTKRFRGKGMPTSAHLDNTVKLCTLHNMGEIKQSYVVFDQSQAKNPGKEFVRRDPTNSAIWTICFGFEYTNQKKYLEHGQTWYYGVEQNRSMTLTRIRNRLHGTLGNGGLFEP